MTEVGQCPPEKGSGANLVSQEIEKLQHPRYRIHRRTAQKKTVSKRPFPKSPGLPPSRESLTAKK